MSVRSVSFPDTMPWFTKYVEGVVKSVNVFFQERTRAKLMAARGDAAGQRKPSTRRSRKRPRSQLEVTCCTGRTITGRESFVNGDPARASLAGSTATTLAEEAAANFTEEDFSLKPTVAYPKARQVRILSVNIRGMLGVLSPLVDRCFICVMFIFY